MTDLYIEERVYSSDAFDVIEFDHIPDHLLEELVAD